MCRRWLSLACRLPADDMQVAERWGDRKAEGLLGSHLITSIVFYEFL
jgi:hypothetical protein